MNTMHKTILATTAATMMATLGAGPVLADEQRSSNKYEATGLGSGLVIGALAGGPFGAILGGAAGALLGDRMDRDGEERRTLRAQLGEEAEHSAELRQRVAVLSDDLAHRDELIARRDHVIANVSTQLERIGEVLEFSVLFRTGASELDDASEQRLARLGRTLADMDGIEVWIEGHADPRGDETLNDALSTARADAVRDVLERSGIRAGSISTVAHGARASEAPEGDLEAYALERRVDIRLMLDEATLRMAGQRP